MPESYIDSFSLVDAQVDELEKIAALSAGMGRFIGAGIGAGLGGAHGYATAPPEQRAGKAIKGALIGGAAGFAGGQALTQAGRQQALRFGRRQLHGATGYLPGQGWRGQNLKAAPGETIQKARVRALQGEKMKWTVPDEHVKDPKKALENLKAKKKAELDKGEPTFGDKTLGQRFAGTKAGEWWKDSGVRNFLLNRRIAAERSQRALAEEGLTSIPGLAKGYATGTDNLSRLGVLKSNITAPGLALGVGLPAAFAAPGVVEGVRQRDPKQVARTLAETAGYSVGGGLPMLAALGTGTAVSAGAGRLFGSGQQAPTQAAAGPASSLPGRVGAIQRTPVGQVVQGGVRRHV